MKTIRCYFEQSKETKGAVRYEEPSASDNPLYLIGTLYLRKASIESMLGSSYPKEIVVIVYLPENGGDVGSLQLMLGGNGDAPKVPSD